MSISVVDSLEKAVKVAAEVASARKRWGKQASYGYTSPQIADSLIFIMDAYKANTASEIETVKANADAAIEDLRAQLTKANRQLAAANARAARREKATLTPEEIVNGREA